ncbi:MAG: glyoxalase [Cyanobacteria bacterium]|nr:glyoxalase [Cyanobacteriota bacterium]
MANLEVTEFKTYVPAKNFEESKQFYRDLGFELTEAWGRSFDCRFGNALFRLQNYYVKDWADNFMMQFQVPDARAWYEHVKPIIESGKFSNVRVSEPEETEGVILFHVWDPCGVLLIFIQ